MHLGHKTSRANKNPTLVDAALGPSPAGASDNPTTTAPDDVLNIEFTGRSRVETLLDFRLQPGALLAASLFLRHCRDNGGFPVAIGIFAYLRVHEFFEGGR